MAINETTAIIVKKEIKPNNPILVVGLPGIGNVGKLVAEHLKNEFNAEKFATMYSNHFPHRVVMLKNGGIRLVSNRFYIIKSKKKNGNDIILLTGDDQAVTPEGQYEVNMKIVDFFKNTLKGNFVYTIGGYSTNEPISGVPRVFGNATNKKVITQFKGSKILFGKSRGMIWGSAGLVVAFAKMNKMDGVCLMGETAFMDLDAAAAKSVLVVLSERLGLTIDTKNLDKIINKTAQALKELEQQMNVSLQGGPGTLPAGPPKHEQSPNYIR
jgi:uncharacterized protein